MQLNRWCGIAFEGVVLSGSQMMEKLRGGRDSMAKGVKVLTTRCFENIAGLGIYRDDHA